VSKFLPSLISLQDTELLVLGCLKWDVSCVTPLDFVDLIISRLPILNKNCDCIDPEKIRKHAQAFISLAVRGKFAIIYTIYNFNLLRAFKIFQNSHVATKIDLFFEIKYLHAQWRTIQSPYHQLILVNFSKRKRMIREYLSLLFFALMHKHKDYDDRARL
jgi:hypothetical protein